MPCAPYHRQTTTDLHPMIQLLVYGPFLLAAIAIGVVYYRLRRRRVGARLTISALCGAGVFAGIWLVLIGVFYAALLEPWPLSLRQGPDTDFAHTCFKRHLWVSEHPSSVFGIYCRDEWGFGGDSIRSIHFSFSDRLQVLQIPRLKELKRVDDPNRRAFRYTRGPAWWPSEARLRALPEAYELQGREYLWLDSVAQVAYFQTGF